MAECGEEIQHEGIAAMHSDCLYDFYCESCKDVGLNTEAKGYCVDCNDYLCQGCINAHKRSRPLRRHEILDQNEMPREAPLSQDHVNREIFTKCKLHNSKTVEYYCVSHRELVCSACFVKVHRHCKEIQSIHEESESIIGSREYNDFTDGLKDMNKEASDMISKAHDNKAALDHFTTKATEQLKSFRAEVNAIFDEMEKSLLTEIRSILSEDNDTMDEMTEQLTYICDTVKALIAETGKLADSKLVGQLFIQIKEKQNNLVFLKEKLMQAEKRNKVRLVEFEANNDVRTAFKTTGLGKIKFQTKCVNTEERVLGITTTGRIHKSTAKNDLLRGHPIYEPYNPNSSLPTSQTTGGQSQVQPTGSSILPMQRNTKNTTVTIVDPNAGKDVDAVPRQTEASSTGAKTKLTSRSDIEPMYEPYNPRSLPTSQTTGGQSQVQPTGSSILPMQRNTKNTTVKIVDPNAGKDVDAVPQQTEASSTGAKTKLTSRSDIENLYRTTRSILNKLTLQKFQTLVSQMQALPIDTETKLKGVVDLVFEKAISEPNYSVAYGEPNYSVAYANMCSCLSMFKVPSENNPRELVNFRAVLLTRCQREFEDTSSEAIFKQKHKEIEAAEDSKKDELKAELEHEEYKAKRRNLGSIRFLGELFKLNMFTENIMHDCVYKLLRTKDPENIKCLCFLLTVIGKVLDVDKAKPRMDQYFHFMQIIVNDKKMAPKVLFMLQEVIDLRLNKWVSRRQNTFSPKTLDQIHKENKQEDQEKALSSQQPQLDKEHTKTTQWTGENARSSNYDLYLSQPSPLTFASDQFGIPRQQNPYEAVPFPGYVQNYGHNIQTQRQQTPYQQTLIQQTQLYQTDPLLPGSRNPFTNMERHQSPRRTQSQSQQGWRAQ